MKHNLDILIKISTLETIINNVPNMKKCLETNVLSLAPEILVKEGAETHFDIGLWDADFDFTKDGFEISASEFCSGGGCNVKISLDRQLSITNMSVTSGHDKSGNITRFMAAMDQLQFSDISIIELEASTEVENYNEIMDILKEKDLLM